MLKRSLSILTICLFTLTLVKSTYATPVAGGFFGDTKILAGNSLSASTLFFTITDTADKPLSSPYFDISDMKPGDSQSKTIRIKKGGIEDFKYNLTFHKTDGDEGLCSALKIETKLEGTTVYNGNLSSLTINPTSTISSSGTDQWEITISLSDSSSELENKTCSFDLAFKGWQINSDGSWGFRDQHSIGNSITTGTWEDNTTQSDQSGTELAQPTVSDTGTEQTQDNLSVTPTPTPTPDQSLNSDSPPALETSVGVN